MLTYELKKSPGVPLYEALYRCIRGDILSGALRPGEKLPSKRALAENLEVSKITVEAAYSQLLSEGYICSREKVGYFVETVERRAPVPARAMGASILPDSCAGIPSVTARYSRSKPPLCSCEASRRCACA